MIRCELDALPITETNTFDYRSANPGVSHKCGHDGHMAILLQLSILLKDNSFSTGRVILLFQAAEETGKGAHAVLHDPKFSQIIPDYIFALHNIPGAPLHEIIIMESGFSAEVESFSLMLTGITSHAAEPQNGINPAFAIAALLSKFEALQVPDLNSDHFAILTPVYLTVGEQSYGVSPEKGELHYTIRTWSTETMSRLKSEINNIIDDVIQSEQLEYVLDWFEYFPASQNDPECNLYIENAALQNNYTVQKRNYPFTFGEDFGWFSKEHQSGMFGLGAGEQSPALHHDHYDFPDEIIETGALMFYNIIEQILSNQQS